MNLFFYIFLHRFETKMRLLVGNAFQNMNEIHILMMTEISTSKINQAYCSTTTKNNSIKRYP